MNKQTKIKSIGLVIGLSASLLGMTAVASAERELSPTTSEIRSESEFQVITVVSSESSEPSAEVEPLSDEPLPYSMDIDMPIEHQQHAMAMCEKYRIDVDIFFSLMYQESRYQADVFNGSDYGYCQINKVNWEWLEEDYGLDIKDPLNNIEAGALMLSLYLDKANGDYAHALTGYNTGSVKYVNEYARRVLNYGNARY